MRRRFRVAFLGAATAAAGCTCAPAAAQSFVNWETPHVHPLESTAGLGAGEPLLLAVNTADNRLEVFSLASGIPVGLGAAPVGLDPVSVRARVGAGGAAEAWVVNHVSDSISIVDLGSMRVRATIRTADEPADVVFAAGRAFVTMSQMNQVHVFDAANPLGSAPTILAIQGEDPRALATDGVRVYAAVFESGNRTTVLSQQVVESAVNPYPGDASPPPNFGSAFFPAIAAGLPAPPHTGLIVRKDEFGVWRDDNGGDWSAAVTWDLHDHDVAIIDATTLGVTYATGLMNANMALAARPDGSVTVVGTEAINEVRFEPNVNGVFVRVHLAVFDPASPGSAVVTDLNPHLTYTTSIVPQGMRDLSIGDPRAIAWNAAGTRGYVAGMGSNNVIVIDAAGARLGQVQVGQGPTGLVLDEASGRLYVLNKFDASVTMVDAASATALATVNFFDPTPEAITAGRPHLYDTHATSGLGQAACASCHIDARMDQLAWDLGDPSGQVKVFNQVCNFGFLGGCEDWHPMKGPMTTQTLIGAVQAGPMHWRGDREELSAFNPAFLSILSDDEMLTDEAMAEFEAFLAATRPGPNPNRNIDNSLKTSLMGGSAVTGANLFQTVAFDGGLLTCNQCHAVPTGTTGQLTSAAGLQESQSMKIPQLRNMQEKTGFSRTSMNNNRGFGYIHDGSTDSLFSFLGAPVFTFANNATGDQQRRDITAFLMSFSTDTHAGVGVQTTVVDGAAIPAPQAALLTQMTGLAQSGAVGLVVKGVVGGEARGFAYEAGVFRSDRGAETAAPAALRALAAPGGELTWTLVPAGSQMRIGVDRDEDGWFDADERDACANEADPIVRPGTIYAADTTGDLAVDVFDLLSFLNRWFSGAADRNLDATTDVFDLLDYLDSWFACGA